MLWVVEASLKACCLCSQTAKRLTRPTAIMRGSNVGSTEPCQRNKMLGQFLGSYWTTAGRSGRPRPGLLGGKTSGPSGAMPEVVISEIEIHRGPSPEIRHLLGHKSAKWLWQIEQQCPEV